ncbi:MAG: alpha/beta hydrolase [Gallionella sp.]|nr:alpha/beta hydrolase [Gallionella sp.]
MGIYNRFASPQLLGWFALLLLSLLLTGCVSSPFYYPDSVLYSTPTSVGLKFENVEFTSSDGTRLTGWFIPATGYQDPKHAKGTVIHFHGNAQNISAQWQFVSWLPQRGFNVFVFDYRGYGKSQGTPDPKGVFEDSNAALNYVRSRKDVAPERLLILGQSLGGTNAIAVVGSGNRSGVKAMVIEATFYSYASIANDKIYGAGALVDDTYSAGRYIANIAPIPLLLLHGTFDPVVPYAHSVRLFDKAREPKSMITVEGGGHIEALTSRFGAQYQEALLDFFDTSLSGK